MNAILNLVQKDIALFLKDKTGLALTFLVPFFVIVIFGNIFSGSGDGGGLSAKIKLAVLNETGAPGPQAFARALAREASLQVIEQDADSLPFTRESLRQGIVDHRYNFALIVPTNYLKEDGIGVRLEFLSNPKNQIEAQIVSGLLQKAVYTSLPQLISAQLDDAQRELMGEERYTNFLDGVATLVATSYDDVEYDDVRPNMSFQGLSGILTGDAPTAEGEEANPPSFLQDIVEIERDQVFGKEIKNPYLTRMVGGYAIMFLLFATTGSAASLFEERNDGLFLRLLSMPVKRTHILWSKFLFNTLVGVTQALTLFIAASFLFEVEVFPNFLNLLVVSLFASAACTAFGMLLAAVSKTPQQAQGLGTLLIISMSALGGAWFPVSLMPEAMQALSRFTLVYWGVEAYLRALWEQAGLLGILPDLGILAAITLGLITIASWRFKTGDLFR